MSASSNPSMNISRSVRSGKEVILVKWRDLGFRVLLTRHDDQLESTVLVHLDAPFPSLTLTPETMGSRFKQLLPGQNEPQTGQAAFDRRWQLKGEPSGWVKLLMRTNVLEAVDGFGADLRELRLRGKSMTLTFRNWIRSDAEVASVAHPLKAFIDAISANLSAPQVAVEFKGLRLSRWSLSQGFTFAGTLGEVKVRGEFNAKTEAVQITADYDPLNDAMRGLFITRKEGKIDTHLKQTGAARLLSLHHPILNRTVRVYGEEEAAVSQFLSAPGVAEAVLPLVHGYPGSTIQRDQARLVAKQLSVEQMMKALDVLVYAVERLTAVDQSQSETE